MKVYRVAMFVKVAENNTVHLFARRGDDMEDVIELIPADARRVGAALMQAAIEAEEEENYVKRRERDLTRKMIKKPGDSNGHGTESTEGGTDGDDE